MQWNDRRKAKQAASAAMKTTLGQMAKGGTLRQTATTPGRRAFGKAERNAVQAEVRGNKDDFRPRAERYADATKKVNTTAKIGKIDAADGRALSDKMDKRGQQKKYLPKTGK